jgi:serine/threonine-protein kinase
MSQDPLIGQLIEGKYAVDRLVGEGGMGKVYGGRNVRTESPVAIKTLIPELVKDATLVKRFEIEAKAASNLHHPNTIRIFDFGEHAGMLFMVMELLNGASLEGTLRKEGKLEPRRVLRIMNQVCRSLSEAHSLGLVHRDLKPDNIFLNRAGGEADFVKVLDFGVAKLKDNRYGQATLTQAGMIFGTPVYMSPEQARAFDIDGRSDIYALGVIMYECLTGKPPFEASDPVAILIQHVQEPPPPFRERNPSTPDMPEVEAMVMRCLRKKPDERYGSVNELLQAIEGLEARLGAGQTTGQSAVGGATLLLDQTATEGGVPDPTRIGTRRAPQPADQLGIGDPTGANYVLGGSQTHFGDRPPQARAGLSTGLLVGIVVLALAVVGTGLFLVVRLATPPAPPVPEVASPQPVPSEEAPPGAGTEAGAPAEATPEATEPVAPVRDYTAVVEGASTRLARARAAAGTAASRAVIAFTIREANGVEATLRATDGGVEEGPLPLQVVRMRPTGEDAATELTFEVSAEGYRTLVLGLPVDTVGEHVVTLQRAGRTGPPGGSGGSGSPGRQPVRTGPLDDPYR